MTATWSAVLDALEADADRLAAAAGDPAAVELLLREGVGAVPPDAAALGALPRHLVARAEAVLARIRACEAALRDGRDAAGAALAARPSSSPPTPRYIDRAF